MKQVLSAAIVLLSLPLASLMSTTTGAQASISHSPPRSIAYRHHGPPHHGHKCKAHGYTAFCRRVPPGPCREPINHVRHDAHEVCEKGHWTGFHVPGHKHHKEIEIFVRTDRPHGIEVVMQEVGCPSPTPHKGGFCFRIEAFGFDRHDGRYDIPTNPSDLVAKLFAQLYEFNPKSGKYGKLGASRSDKDGKHDYKISSGGLYYLKP